MYALSQTVSTAKRIISVALRQLRIYYMGMETETTIPHGALTTAEAAARLGCEPGHVRTLIHQGHFEVIGLYRAQGAKGRPSNLVSADAVYARLALCLKPGRRAKTSQPAGITTE